MTRDRYNKKEYGDTGGTPNNVYLTVASDQVQNTNLERSCQKIISWIQKYIKYYQDCCSITQVKTLADLKGLFESVVNENSSGMFKTTIDYASLETETQQILKVLKHQIESFVQLLNEEFNHVNQGNAAESLIFSIICYHHLTGKLMKCIPRNYSSITTTSNTKEIKELEGYLVEWLLLLDIEVIYNSDQKKLYYFTHRDNGLDEEVRRLFKVKKISDRRGLVLFLKANALVGKSNDVAEVLRNIENDQTLLKLLFLFNLAWKYDSFYSSNTTNNYSSFNYNLPYSFSAKALTTALSEVDIRCLKHIYKKDKNPCPMVNIISRIDYELAVGETIVELLRNINKQSEEINADKYTTTTCLQTLLSNVFKYAVSGENINTLHTLMQNQDFVYFFRSKLLETKEFSGPFVNNVLLQDYCDEKLALHLINSSNGNGVSLKNLVKLCSDKDSIQVLVIDKIKDLVSNNNNYYNYYYSRDPIVINIIKEIIANSAHNIILTPISKEKLERWISGLNNINNIGNSLEFFEKCQITFIPNTNSLLDVALRSIIKRIIKIKTIKDMNFWIKTGIESYSFNYLYLYDLFFIIAEEFLNDFDVYSSKEVLAFEFLFKSNQQMATKFNNEIFLRIKQRFIQEIEKLNRNEFTSKELQSNILKEENVNYFELINYISENRIGRKDYENCLETFLQSKGILNELKKTYQLLSALECDVSKTINLFVQLEAQMDDAPLYKIDQFILKNKKEIETIQKEILSKVSCNDNLDLFETISQSQIFFFYYSRGNQQDKIKIQKISAYISTCIEEIKNTIKNILLGKGDIDKILKGINFYNMHLPSEKKFLSLIGFDQRSMQSLLDAFELYQLKQHLVDFSELVRIYELPFYGEHYDILISDSRTAFNDSSTKLQELKQFIGEIDESTLRVFKHYIEYKTLVEYLNQHNFTENELRIINNKVAGNSFDEEIIQHLLSAKKLIDPLLDAMHGKFNEMLEFFDVLKDLQINQKQLDAMKECANNLEKVNNVVQSANQTSENLQYTVTQILKQGILFFDLEKIQYHVKVNDQLISEKEFKNLILTSTFQKLLSKELELFSTSGMFLESILKIISQLRNISHVCFQHRTLEFPLIILNDIPTMESILQVLKGISKEWHRKINQNNITYFNMKQRLIILRYLKEDTNISFNSIKHIVQSYFNISETNLHKCLQEIQNYLSNNSLLLDSSQFDWTNFTDVGPKLEQMENVILGALKEFILKITEVATSTPIPALSDIDGIDPCSVVSFIDLSNLFSLEQYYYLIYLQESVFLKSSNILFCKSDLTIIDIDVFLETALGGLNGRFVIYQIERLNGITRSYLLSKLLKFKSSIKNIQRQERQIVCVITNIESIGSSLPVQTKAISAVPTGNLEKIITKSFKFNKLFTLTSDVSGDGKTTTARTYLQEKKKKGYSISEIYYNNSSNASQLFKILFGAFGDEKGVIFLNISEDVDLKELNLFLLQLLLMGVFIDFSNGETVCVPNTKQWEMIIEVPSPTYLKDILLLSNNIATAMSVQKDFIVDDEARLFAEFFHYFKTGSLNKVSRNGEEIQIVKSFSLNDSQVRKYILDAYAENISRNDSQKSLFYLHTFTKFMAKRCHYLNDSTFSKFNIINNQIPTYFEHMLNEASDFMRHLFEHYEEFDYFSIYNSTEGNPIILPLKRSAQKPQFLKNLEEEYKRHGHQTELIESIENLKYVEKLVSYIALALEIKEKIVVDILYRHSYILTPHFAVQFLKIIEKISIGYPITLEGETGTGKTKLLEVISDLLAYQGTGRGNTNDQFPNLEKILISNDTIRTYDRQYNNNQLNNIYNDTEPWTTTIEGVELLLLNQSIPTEIKDSVFDVINDFVMDINNQPFVCSLSTGNKNITIIDELSKYKLAVQSFNELEQRSNALLKCLSALFKSNNYFSNTMLSAIKIEIETKIRPFLPNAIIVVENNRYNLLGYLDTVLSRQPIHEAIKQYSIKCYEVSGFVDSMKKFVADMLDNHPILKPSQELLDLLERQNINHEEVSQLLLEFIKTPLHSFFKAILMNNAVSEDDIYLKLKKKIDLARKCEEKKERIKFVFFIDEMNTSSHMGLMKQLIYDKYWQKVDGYLPSNILFVSAINPKKDDLYQVNILPKTMELYKSKWPDTDEGMEKDYILALVRSNTNIFRNSLKESQKQFLVELIMETHKATKLILKEERKKKTTKSFLSQRDIQRVFKVFNFFFEKFFGEFTDFGVDMKLSKVFTKTTLSMMAAVGVCYYLRMNKENRQVLDKKVSNLIQKQVGELPSQCKTLSNLMKLAVNTTSKHLEIPTSICKNEALTENMFSLIVGIESMVPVLLLGPPGCSKVSNYFLYFDKLF